MANSSDVVDGANTKTTDYNNLRADVLNTSTGHTHSGVDSKALAQGSVGAGMLAVGASFNAQVPTYIVLSPTDFVPLKETYKWHIAAAAIRNNGGTSPNTLIVTAPIHLPHASQITHVKVYWYRDDAAAAGTAIFQRTDFAGGSTTIAACNSNSSAGAHTVEADITTGMEDVDNTTGQLNLYLNLTTNNSDDDVWFLGAIITCLVSKPVP